MTYRIRRKPAAQPTFTDNLSAEQRSDLLDGYTIVPGTGFANREAAFCSAWAAHRERLLPEFIAQNPGRRPFAEWVTAIVPGHGQRPLLHPLPSYVQRRFGIYHTSIWTINPTGERLYAQLPEEIHLARAGLLQQGELERARERLANDMDPGRFVWPADLQ